MKFECPKCGKGNDATDKLPDSACDENDFTCECGAVLKIGWFAEVEVRGVVDMPPNAKLTGSDYDD